MKRSGILLPAMLLALSLPLFSQEPVQQQKYWVTEEQLQQLETEQEIKDRLEYNIDTESFEKAKKVILDVLSKK